MNVEEQARIQAMRLSNDFSKYIAVDNPTEKALLNVVLDDKDKDKDEEYGYLEDEVDYLNSELAMQEDVLNKIAEVLHDSGLTVEGKLDKIDDIFHSL